MGDAWILDAVRTPRGQGNKETRALSGITPGIATLIERV